MKDKRERGESEPISGGPLVAIDNHWKSLDRYSHPHCHTWQHGTHIDSLPKTKDEKP